MKRILRPAAVVACFVALIALLLGAKDVAGAEESQDCVRAPSRSATG